MNLPLNWQFSTYKVTNLHKTMTARRTVKNNLLFKQRMKFAVGKNSVMQSPLYCDNFPIQSFAGNFLI